MLNFEYLPSDLQNDPADADVHELIFTNAAISGQTRFQGIGPLLRIHRSPRGAGFGGDTSYQVMVGAPGEYNLTHALPSICSFVSYLAPFCFLKYFLKAHYINDTVVFMHKLISYVWKTKIGALLLVKLSSLKHTGSLSP